MANLLMHYSLSLLTGLCIIKLSLKEKSFFPKPFFLSLGLILGLCLSGIITFLHFVLFQHYHAWGLFTLHLSFTAVLGGLYLWRRSTWILPKTTTTPIRLKSQLGWIFGLAGLWILLAIATYLMAKRLPFGNWDAWALWNMKAKFLINSGSNWRALFDQTHWHTQPDYPLLLPLINIWLQNLSTIHFSIIPFQTGILLTLAASFTLYAGLSAFIPQRMALLAAAMLGLNPATLFSGTSQYADILLAALLLTSLITLTLTLRHKQTSMALGTGLFLGFMTFAKNEGIAMMGLLVGLSGLYLLFDRRPSRAANIKLLAPLIAAVVIGALSTLSFKLFLAPPNRDILTNMRSDQLVFFNLHGLNITWTALINEIIQPNWGGIWIFLIASFFLGFKKFFVKECKVFTLFICSYGLILLIIYLTTSNFDLAWRLKSTISRILFYLLPSLLYLSFYAHWRPLTDQEKIKHP